jgi:uncharacterized protein GlcG (DUF336 family)
VRRTILERIAWVLLLVAPAWGQDGLTAAEVNAVIEKAATAIDSRSLVIAVTDRQGNILGLFRKTDAPTEATGNFGKAVDTNELAIATARTAAFFSHDQAPLSSRTVRYISGIHFPPGIRFTGNAALYGIENTNRGCGFNVAFEPGQDVPPARSLDGSRPGLGIQTGKADLGDSDPTAVNPGGIPLYKNGRMVGGVGVAGDSPAVVEYAALIGSVGAGFGPVPAAPGVVFVDGIALPFADQTTAPDGRPAGGFDGVYVVEPIASPGPAPEGDLVAPRDGSRLTAAEIRGIIDQAIAAANRTRGIIRLPLGTRARMVFAVSDLDGAVLALHRMPDATFFSVDVAVAKARNMVYFNSAERVGADLPGVPAGTNVTSRTISFGAQPLFPPGIDETVPGPFFELYRRDTENPCSQGMQPANANQNGIVFFAGSLPLFRNGVLVGGLGVSGDGVEQDDYVSALAAAGYEAPQDSRADRIFIDGVRLPYLKFPRNPEK